MKAVPSQSEIAERNRRESFRMNDRVGLRVRSLSESQYRECRDTSSNMFEKRRILNGILANRDAQRSALRTIRDDDSTIAAYLQSIDERLEAMARLLSIEDNSAPDTPTHDVNISGTGMRFQHEEPLTRGGHLMLDLQLFPSRTCLSLLANVVRCTELPKPPRRGGRFMVAADFVDIHEDDRELLIRHVHDLQMDYVRRGALRS